jgi:hypothetical protein
MNDNIYIFIIIILTLFIITYGGHNYQNKVEYDSSYFDNFSIIQILENRLVKLDKKIEFGENDNINIKKYINFKLIPNMIGVYYIKIKPYSLFDVNKMVDDSNSKILIIFNHNKVRFLELLVKNENNIGFFYGLTKNISITGVFPVYNNSNETIIITIFIVKKPFWHN